MSPARFRMQMAAAGLIVAATLAAILLVGAAATPDWRLW